MHRLIFLIILVFPMSLHADNSREDVWSIDRDSEPVVVENAVEVDQSREKKIIHPNDSYVSPSSRQAIPGEVISREGKKYKVWSTTGPVPVNKDLSLQDEKTNGMSSGNIGVIVDGR